MVSELDKASESWGVKVLRYEIKNITPPHDILAAMEKQMRAEREKRAVILTSEGTRDAAINTAEGVKQEVIKASEARKQQQINEAEGQASAILAVATATAEGIRKVAESIKMDGGYEAVQLRVAEQYIGQFGELAKKSNTLVLPANVADVGSMIALAMTAIKAEGAGLGRRGAARAPVAIACSGDSRFEETGEQEVKSSNDLLLIAIQPAYHSTALLSRTGLITVSAAPRPESSAAAPIGVTLSPL